MKDIEGQISLTDLFELISPQQKFDEPPILLHEGQRVYKVVRGDVEEHIVTGESWTCGEENRGYRLKRVGGCWDCTWNTQINNRVVFTDRIRADQEANKYLSENEHILAKDIRATNVVAYRYKYNDNEFVDFYAVLKNGDVYYHYGSMYEHIGDKKEIKSFEKKKHECMGRNVCEEIEDYQPVFHNMYKRKNEKWKYAAARYQYING